MDVNLLHERVHDMCYINKSLKKKLTLDFVEQAQGPQVRDRILEILTGEAAGGGASGGARTRWKKHLLPIFLVRGSQIQHYRVADEGEESGQEAGVETSPIIVRDDQWTGQFQRCQNCGDIIDLIDNDTRRCRWHPSNTTPSAYICKLMKSKVLTISSRNGHAAEVYFMRSLARAPDIGAKPILHYR